MYDVSGCINMGALMSGVSVGVEGNSHGRGFCVKGGMYVSGFGSVLFFGLFVFVSLITAG